MGEIFSLIEASRIGLHYLFLISQNNFLVRSVELKTDFAFDLAVSTKKGGGRESISMLQPNPVGLDERLFTGELVF